MTAGGTHWAECGSNLRVPSPMGRAVKSYLEPRLQTGIPPVRVTPLLSLHHLESRKPRFSYTPANLEVLMLGQLARQVHSLVSAPLWYHHDAADLLHLGVIWWAYPIEVPCNLETRGSRAKEILSTSPDLGLSALCLIPFSENKDRVSQMWPECPASKTPGGAYSKR